ncbi:hypothetical protein FA13DRAFT_7625 [Coprinellus micaceus]|uniref:Uncharacterized protein n=1 Tax=Coprinellus micaceus TaxID=71717 RepID=A0A4Y7U0E2_COPMI|nr:hypothetical protein FA13DRAFT_7625 [Coprinellus micaceus]
MFTKGYLSHLERIDIRQRNPVYCVLPGDRNRFEGPFNVLSAVLSNVNKLTHFALDYRRTGFEGFYYSFKGHVAAITSANLLETLEIYPPGQFLCSRPLDEIDVELDKVYQGRADVRNRQTKFNIILHGIHRTDGTSQDLLPQAVERGHRISLEEE